MRLRGPIDLPHSLQGGQAFLWREEDGAYVGAIERRPVRLRPLAGGDVEATGAPRAAFERYFRLEPEDAARRARLALDPVLSPAMQALPGLRLLRQDPWETLVAFITSANNNVLRIEGILRRLAAAEGPGEAAVLPPPDAVAAMSAARLRALGLGYRAPFLRETARRVADGEVDLMALRGRPTSEVRAALLELPGVGPKVADCVALFSLDRDDAFPVDRWVLRAVSEALFGGREASAREAREAAARRWGADAGLAQQYLFHALRMRDAAPGTRRLPPQRTSTSPPVGRGT